MWRFYRISEREATIAKLHRFIELAAFDLRCQILQYICKTFVRGGARGSSPQFGNFGGIRNKKRSRNIDNLLLLNLIFSKKVTKMWWNSPSFLLASKQNWEISSNFVAFIEIWALAPQIKILTKALICTKWSALLNNETVATAAATSLHSAVFCTFFVRHFM